MGIRITAMAVLVALAITPSWGAGPRYGPAGGIGSTTSTYATSGSEPAGGTYSISGTTGVATFGGINLPSQSANRVFAAPSGASGVPVFRSLTVADVPTLNQNSTGTAGNVTGVVAVANGGTGAAAGSGVVLDNISGLSSTGLMRRTGTGTYSLGTTVANTELATMPASTIKGNATAGVASATDLTGSAVYKLLPSQCQNILAYGGNNGGTADNSAAFSAAVAASPVGQICVYLPSGTYSFTTSPQISVPSGSAFGSAVITGDGQDVTVIKMAAGTQGPTILLNARNQSLSVRNLTITASAAETTVPGLYIGMNVDISAGPSPAHNDIENVTIRGSDGYNVANTFAQGLYVYGLSNVNVRNVGIYGGCGAGYCASSATTTGIYTVGTANRIPVALNFTQIDADGFGQAFYYGSFVQGVTMSHVNFVGGYNGIILPAGTNSNDQLAVGFSHMNNAGTDIAISGSMSGISIIGCNLYLFQGAAAINISGAEASMVGNVITQLGSATGNGIVIGGSYAFPKVITGNTFRGFATAVWLQTGSSSTNVQSNAYLGNTTNTLNQGTSNTLGGGSQ